MSVNRSIGRVVSHLFHCRFVLTHYLLEILRNKKTKYAIFLLFFSEITNFCCGRLAVHAHVQICLYMYVLYHAMNYSCGITSFSSIQVLNQETGVSWNKRFKRQFGTMTKVSMNMMELIV